MTSPDPMPELVRRAAAAHAAYVRADDRMDPASAAAGSCWEAALEAAGLPEALARIAELENTINWHTTCTGCAKALDASYAETARAERAEARVVELGAELTGARDALRLVERDRDHWRAAVERVRALSAELAAAAGSGLMPARADAYREVARLIGRALDAAGTPDSLDPRRPGRRGVVGTAPASAGQDGVAAGTPAPTDDEGAPNEPIVQELAEYYRYLDCPTVIDPADPDDCANMAAVTIQWLRARGVIASPAPAGAHQDAVRVQHPDGSMSGEPRT